MASGSRENSLVRAVARWVKGWAESVLKEPDASVALPVDDSRSPGETAGATVSVPPPSQESAGGPPEHWLRLVRSKRPGPPADWVERVRRGAPHLLEGLELEGEGSEAFAGPPKAEPLSPTAPVGPPRGETVPVTRTAPTPQARPRIGLGRVGTPPRRELEAHPSPAPVSPVERHGDSWPVRPTETRARGDTASSEPRRSPAPSSTGSHPGEHLSRRPRAHGPESPAPERPLREAPRGGRLSSSEETAPSTRSTDAREGARSTRARGLSLRPLPETSFPERSPGSAPFLARHSGELRNVPVFSRERGVWPGSAREDFAPPSRPHASLTAAPPVARSSSLVSSEPAPRELSFLREEGRAETSSPDVASLSDVSHAWPEPPELPSIEPTDPLAMLRDWERLRRLEREQRGE
jgi:hypothetical protein